MMLMEAMMIRLSCVQERLLVINSHLGKRMQTLPNQQISKRAKGNLRKNSQEMIMYRTKLKLHLNSFTNVVKIFLRSMKWLPFALKVIKR